MDKITVIVVDDHPLFRQGVVEAISLSPDISVIGQAADGEQALNLIQAKKPNVALLDIGMPGINGQQLTHHITSEKLPTKVILLTGYDDSEQILHAAIAGAAGYCSKDIQPAELTQVIRHVMNGRYVIGQQIFDQKEFEYWLHKQLEMARRSYSEPGNPFHPLSDREMEVLELVVKGLSNKEIAILLGISHQTVKNHVTAILRKFVVEDRTQAVVYALRRGWVKLGSEKHQE